LVYPQIGEYLLWALIHHHHHHFHLLHQLSPLFV
jgi:hypothetical protein